MTITAELQGSGSRVFKVNVADYVRLQPVVAITVIVNYLF